MASAAVIHAIADKLRPTLRRQFLDAVKKLQGRMSIEALADAVARGGVSVELDAAMRAWPDDLKAAVGTINRVFEETAQAAEREFAKRFRLDVRFDFVNPRALEAADLFGARMVRQVSDETRAALRAIIHRSVEQGIAPRQAAQLIRPIVGLTQRQALAVMNYQLSLLTAGGQQAAALSAAERYAAKLHRQRALNIARTKTIDASSLGRHETWREAQRKGYLPPDQRKRWIITDDDRLCPLCAQMALPWPGQEVPLNAPFITPDGRSIDGPTLHPSCVPADSLANSCGAIHAATQRWYDGDLCIVRTASGQELACTQNHPILTDRGFIAAHLLKVGDNVIRHSGVYREIGRRHDHEHMPARIQQITETCARSREMAAIPVPVAAEDFHGDGRQSEVAIVWANRLLMNRLAASFAQQRRELALGWRYVELPLLDGARASDEFIDRSDSAPHRTMCRQHLLAALGAGHALPLQTLSFTTSANRNASLTKTQTDDLSRDVEASGDLFFGPPGEVPLDDPVVWHRNTSGRNTRRMFPRRLDTATPQPVIAGRGVDAELARDVCHGLTGEVTRDQLVDLYFRPFSGHVFNLETSTNVYTANGIVSHNCRCTTSLVIPKRARAAA